MRHKYGKLKIKYGDDIEQEIKKESYNRGRIITIDVMNTGLLKAMEKIQKHV